MPTYLRAAAAIAVVAVLATGMLALSGLPNSGNRTPPPSNVATPPPTASPSPTERPDSSGAPLDTSAWIPYSSSQYGLSISYPPGWTATPATRGWTFEGDSALDPLSPAMDSFASPRGTVRVSIWRLGDESIPGGVDEAIPPADSVVEWAVEFCRLTANTGCDEIPARAVPMCLEYRDCHPATLVAFENDVQAYFSGGASEDDVYVAVVWRPELHPTTAEFGSSRLLLEAFLSTIGGGGNAGVWPEGYLP